MCEAFAHARLWPICGAIGLDKVGFLIRTIDGKPSMRPTILLLAASIAAINFSSGLRAQPNSKLTVTSIEEAGPEFAIQGEYLGTIQSSRYGGEMLGVQIVTRSGFSASSIFS